jgi:hypothetical protein
VSTGQASIPELQDGGQRARSELNPQAANVASQADLQGTRDLGRRTGRSVWTRKGTPFKPKTRMRCGSVGANGNPAVQAVKVVARLHKTLIWERARQVNRLGY